MSTNEAELEDKDSESEADSAETRLDLAYDTSLKVLYCYCGERRRGDIKECLVAISRNNSLAIDINEIDLCRGGEGHNLAKDDIISKFLQTLANTSTMQQ